jgi:hypothetical protein
LAGQWHLAGGLPNLRSSRTKKGKEVGFEPANGVRFGTYARPHADKEMRAALADDPRPDRSEELEAKVKATYEILTTPDDRWLPAPIVRRNLNLWHPPVEETNKPKPRNYRKHPTTKIEIANKDVFYSLYNSNDLKHGNDGKAVDIDKLENESFAKRAWNAAPDLPKKSRRKGKISAPYLCRYPLASIYYMRGEINGDGAEVISWRRYREPPPRVFPITGRFTLILKTAYAKRNQGYETARHNRAPRDACRKGARRVQRHPEGRSQEAIHDAL